MRPSYAVLALTSLLATACPSTRDRPPGNPRPPGGGGNCGNSRIDNGETCDKAIAAGMPGACPADCSDGNACTSDVLSGGAATCNVTCSSSAIANCANADGCCPEGCTSASD